MASSRKGVKKMGRKRAALIAERKKASLSVAEIADLLEISPSFYYKIESGDRNPTISLAKRISDLFSKSVEALFFGEVLDETSNGVAGTGTDG